MTLDRSLRLLGLLLLLCAAAPAIADDDADPAAFTLIDAGRGLTMHKEIYALPFTHANRYSGAGTEAVFQLSAKHDLFATRFYFAYTQISFWQAYDTGGSSPFRDTNYNPEIFYRHPESRLGPGLAGFDAGAEHESNGQRLPLSRSWNLLYVAPHCHGERWLVYLKLRYRVPEDDKTSPDDPLGDDNPDITDYLGYSDLHLYYALPRGHLLHFLMRGYLGTTKGNVSLNWSFPVPGDMDAYLVARFFSGYGESLLDYDKSINRIGVGVMFNR
ncbi:MAG: phospholipase A [Krumholzibacteria bacterium]|nr:phospholipase A [Candidatus Krumholzibacteria bacterium]